MTVSTRIRNQIDRRAVGSTSLALVDRLMPTPLRPLAVDSDVAADPVLSRRPLVSVIIPCFNYGRFLEASVGSCLSQRSVDVEIIIVDDASTDDSAAVADGLAARDPRVRVIRNATNQNHVRTFNNGYAVASGEFIVRLDADDLLTPGSLARAIALFDAHPSVGLVYGNPRHFETAEPPQPHTSGHLSWTVWAGQRWLAERCRVGVNCITTPEAIVRASTMAEVGPLRTELRFAQDMELWVRLSGVADVGRVNGVDQALHRDHAASMSVTDGAGILTDLHERREVFRVTFALVGDRIEDSARLSDLASRTLAREALSHACHALDRGRATAEQTAAYVDFARETLPDWEDLPEARGLRRRLRIGAGRVQRHPVYVARSIADTLRGDLQHVRWRTRGI
jgi:hypothetical protein